MTSSESVRSTKIFSLAEVRSQRLLGSSEVNLTSDRFASILTRVDAVTAPVLQVIDLTTQRSVCLIDLTFLLEIGLRSRLVQCKVNFTGQWAAFHDDRDLRFLDLTSKAPAQSVTLHGVNEIQHVKWTTNTAVTLFTDNGNVCQVDVSVTTKARPRIPAPQRKLTDLTGTVIDFHASKSITAAVTVEFPNKVPVGTLFIDQSTMRALAVGFDAVTAADDNSPSNAVSLFVCADVLDHDHSTLVVTSLSCLSICRGVSNCAGHWTTNMRQALPRDFSGRDRPVAVHVSSQSDLVFIVTKLNYVHILQLSSGNLIGTVQASDYPVSASILCSDHFGVLLIDADGAVMQVRPDITGWLSQISASQTDDTDYTARLALLRFILQHNTPLTFELLLLLFPSLCQAKAMSKDDLSVFDVLAELTSDEVVKFLPVLCGVHR